MKRLKMVFHFILLMSILHAQDSLKLEWAKEIITPYSVADFPGDMMIDTSNNIYITGNTGVGFGPDRIVTTKYTPEGNEEWIKYDYGVDSNYAESVKIKMDKCQNVYVSGRTNTDSSSSDYYIIKYTNEGEEIWKSYFGGPYMDLSGNMVLDKKGNGAITGWGYNGTQASLTIKFNSEGEQEWLKWYHYNDISTNFGSDIVMDTNSNIYVIGAIDKSPEVRSFLIKYNQDGEIKWVENKEGVFGYKIILNSENDLYSFYSASNHVTLSKYNSDGDELWNSIYTDLTLGFITRNGIITDKDDNIYMAAYHDGSFMLKYDSEGNFVWISAEKLDGAIRAIDLDEKGNIYVAATYEDKIVIARYDSLGNILQTIGFTVDEAIRYQVAKALLDSNNNFYVLGEKETSLFPGESNIILLKYKLDPITSIEEEPENIIKEFALYQNYPNPFNPSTTIKYELKETTNLTLKVYDSLGRLIKVLEEGTKPAGRYELQFDGSNLSSGMYVYKLTAGSFTESKKMILMK